MAGVLVGIVVVVVALAVGTAPGVVVVSAGVVAQVTFSSYVLILPLAPFILFVHLPIPLEKGLPPPRTKDAGMTST